MSSLFLQQFLGSDISLPGGRRSSIHDLGSLCADEATDHNAQRKCLSARATYVDLSYFGTSEEPESLEEVGAFEE